MDVSGFIVKCSVCGKFKFKSGGVEVWDHAVMPGHSMVSHGYCPPCAEAAKKEIEALGSACSG